MCFLRSLSYLKCDDSGSFLFEKIPAHLVNDRSPYLLLGVPHTPKNQFKGIKILSLNFWAFLGISQLYWSVYYIIDFTGNYTKGHLPILTAR